MQQIFQVSHRILIYLFLLLTTTAPAPAIRAIRPAERYRDIFVSSPVLTFLAILPVLVVPHFLVVVVVPPLFVVLVEGFTVVFAVGLGVGVVVPVGFTTVGFPPVVFFCATA